MLIDAAPRAANNSHTASDAKGVVMMNEGPHRTPKKNIDQKATSSKKDVFAKNIRKLHVVVLHFFVWKKNIFADPPIILKHMHCFCAFLDPSASLLATYHGNPPNSCTNRSNSKPGDHNPRRKEIKSS